MMPRMFFTLLLVSLTASAWSAPASARPSRPIVPAPAPADPSRPVGDQTAIEPAVAASPTEIASGSPRLTALSATMMVKVVHPDEVRRKAIARARELGGFPLLVSDAELQLKVPPEHLAQLSELVGASGIVLDKSLQRRDRTEAVAQLEARLRTKRDIFARLRTFLDDSTVSATLMIERSMTQLVAELEQIKGELEVERATTRHALLVVHFQFHREGRITYVRSPFDWLNTVDLDRFLAAF